MFALKNRNLGHFITSHALLLLDYANPSQIRRDPLFDLPQLLLCDMLRHRTPFLNRNAFRDGMMR